MPGKIVTLGDPDSGATLLVGTLRAPAAAVLLPRRSPQFSIGATWLGIVVEAVSDQFALRPTTDGFALAGAADQALALSATDGDIVAAEAAARVSRRFDLPALPAEALLRRLQAAQMAAAAAPPQGRTAARKEVAQAMLALGLDAEAQALLALAMGEDGRAGEDPDLAGLRAMAALLAGRPAEAAGLDDPHLNGSDDVTFWRALRQLAQPGNEAAAAPALAATLPVLLSYPGVLRTRLLPLVAEALVAGGQGKGVQALVEARPEDRSLDFARASLAQADADPTKALALLDKVAARPDRLARFRALRQAIELRLSRGLLEPGAAADGLERALYAWRGDDREFDLRLRIAELRRLAGQWRPAIAMLREAGQLWPERADTLRPRLSDSFAEAVAANGPRQLKPFDLVALAEENGDLLPGGAAGDALATQIADRLVELDLPRRAATTLDKLMQAAPSGAGRAQFGARLAALRQDLGDPTGALDALNQSAAPDLPTPLQETRTLLFARAAAANGDRNSAIAALATLDSEPALATRAELLEAMQDWPAAAAALADLAKRQIPPDGPLDAGQARLLMRLASAAGRAGDTARLAQLRATAGRLPGGELAQMFDLLTAGPLAGIGDIARAGRDARLAKAMPAAVKTLTQ
jgi:hypothetical protein